MFAQGEKMVQTALVCSLGVTGRRPDAPSGASQRRGKVTSLIKGIAGGRLQAAHLKCNVQLELETFEICTI
jgi:hypothetical protein